MTDAHTGSDHADSHQVNYRAVFVALVICTGLSWIADKTLDWGLLDSRRIVAVLVLAVAVAKAQYVMRYFMHLKFEGNWKYVLLLPTAILACGIPLALAPDISLHYYTQVTPQARAVSSEASGSHGTAATHETETPHETGEAPPEH